MLQLRHGGKGGKDRSRKTGVNVIQDDVKPRNLTKDNAMVESSGEMMRQVLPKRPTLVSRKEDVKPDA